MLFYIDKFIKYSTSAISETAYTTWKEENDDVMSKDLLQRVTE